MPLKVNVLTAIQVDEFDAIGFEHLEFNDERGDTEKFAINIKNSGLENGATFMFEDIHEARTFATRMLNEIGKFIDL